MLKSLADSCNAPTGDAVLDAFFDKYNESSSHADSPVYYRFLYKLAEKLKKNKITLIEVGCKYGAASLHFLRGGGEKAVGLDISDRINRDVFQDVDFRFIRGSSTDEKIINSLEPADIVFIDTDHTYETTVREFKLWLPKVKSGGIMLFDDVLAPEFGSSKAWREIKGNKIDLAQLHPVGWGFGAIFT